MFSSSLTSPFITTSTPFKSFISKKTLRGRKTKNPLPSEQPRCSICLEFSHHSKEPLLSCSLCKCTFHPSCYHLPIPSPFPSSFTCQRCTSALTSSIPPSSISCFICSNSDGVLIKNTFNSLYYHKTCLRLIPELYESTDDICKDKIRKWRYKNSCRYCNDKLCKSKAVIKCSNPKCKEYYHIPCAIAKGMVFSFGYMDLYYGLNSEKKAIPFYCACHNKKVAAMYRKDVVYGGNYVDELEEMKFRKKETISINDCDDNENGSTIGNNPTIEDENESIGCNNEMDFFFGDCNEEYRSNNILDLNFNDLMYERMQSDNNMGINFDNISPKIHMNIIPFDF